MTVIQSLLANHPQLLAGLTAASGALGLGILDLILALKPSIAANGVFHWVYLKVLGNAGSQVATDQKANPSS